MSPGATRHQALLSAAAIALGALVLTWVFSRQLAGIPPIEYEHRDDAIITLSHARNLVEYGFIGVSPSGERVEGFSAPLQFWTAALAYRLSPFDYRDFFYWQTWVGAALTGALLAALLVSAGPQRRSTVWWAFVLSAIVAIAFILAQSRVFLLWHASGMENTFKHVTLLALLLMLDRMLHTSRINHYAIIVVAAASLSRADAVVPVGVLLGTFALLWQWRERNFAGLRFIALSLLPWAAYMAWRWWYFGEWSPNTGPAQQIDVAARLSAALEAPGTAIQDYVRWFRDVGGSLHALQLAWLPLLILVVRRSRIGINRCALIVAGSLACPLQYALFGEARLDPARTVTELGLYAALCVPWILGARRDWGLRDLLLGLTMVGLTLAWTSTRPSDRTHIGFAGAYFEGTATQAAALAANDDIPRPSLANADLGVVSWSKQFNVMDFGRLGSAPMARLASPIQYLVEIAKPDIIEIHDAWACAQRDLFTNAVFVDEYQPMAVARTTWLDTHCGHSPEVRSGFWMRKAVRKGRVSPERTFLDAFRGRFDLEILRQELARCLVADGRRPCDHVGRTLFRFVPELKGRGTFGDVERLLRDDPRLAVELAFFTSSVNPDWWRPIVASLDIAPLSVTPRSVTARFREEAGSGAWSEIQLETAASTRWRVDWPQDVPLVVHPRAGVGSATLRITTVDGTPVGEYAMRANVVVGDAFWPSADLPIEVRVVQGGPTNQPPAGWVDAPADPVLMAADGVLFQGWAVDDHGLRAVWVACDGGERLATARRDGERPDISNLFPDSPDRTSSGWAVHLPPGRPCGASPAILRFFAEDVEGSRSEIGTRTLTWAR